MKILFGGHELFLHPSGALFWPEEKMLIVSDMHLEKGSHYARRGFFLPPYDSRTVLLKLMDVCAQTSCTSLILLGDCFHDVKGYNRLRPEDRALFTKLLEWNPVWIYGNHDGDFVPEGFKAMEMFAHRGLKFRHIASQDGTNEISGHYHPKTDVMFHGTRLSCPCFIEDGEKLMLPAFGVYTGGLSVDAPPIKTLFRAPRIYPASKNVFR